MNFRSLATIFVLPLLVCQCAPESPLSPVAIVPPQPLIPLGPQTSFIHNPASSRFDYKSGNATYKLFADGSYTFASLSKKKGADRNRAGRWSYRQTGKSRGELKIDGDVWSLRFTSPHRATAKTSRGWGPYYLEFEWM